MKTLFLIRHAKSSWKDSSLMDAERPLNKRGKRDAPLMGNYLKNLKIKPEIILCSPSQRTLETAQLITKEIGYSWQKVQIRNDIYEGGISEIINIIKEIDNSIKSAFIIGHNPDLTILAEYFTHNYFENIPTCGIVHIQFDIPSWKNIDRNTGKLIFFEFPKKLKKVF